MANGMNPTATSETPKVCSIPGMACDSEDISPFWMARVVARAKIGNHP